MARDRLVPRDGGRGDRARLTAEAADVIFHLLVMLAARDVALADVEAELARLCRFAGLESVTWAPGWLRLDALP